MVGTVTISIEVELAWGHHDVKRNPHTALSKNREEETEALELFLTWCDEFSTPVTFDIVGHLLHNECQGEHIGPHKKEWFSADPETDRNSNPHFYAPDLIEKILSSDVDHEICTHTYSHALCEEMPTDVIRWELERAIEAHQKFGLKAPRSFVPPRHQTPPYKLLEDLGIEVIRRPYMCEKGSNGPVKSFVNAFTQRHPVHRERTVQGITETYCTVSPSLTAGYLRTGRRRPHPSFRSVPRHIRRHLHTRYLRTAIDDAAAADRSVHLWTHLYNFSNNDQLRCIRSLLEYISDYKYVGSFKLLPMQALG